MPTVDDAELALTLLEWSIGDARLALPSGPVWQVYAHRAPERIVARRWSQREAWAEALRLALILS